MKVKGRRAENSSSMPDTTPSAFHILLFPSKSHRNSEARVLITKRKGRRIREAKQLSRGSTAR